MNKPEDFIVGAHKLIDWFGRFPTFHDNEVLNVEMNRRGPSIVMKIHSFIMTQEIEKDGRIKLDKHSIVTIIWDKISKVELHNFNDCNYLFELQFSMNSDGSITTCVDTSCGLYGEIVSAEVTILEIQPIDPKSHCAIRSVYRAS